MRISEIMTPAPECCRPEQTIQEAAHIMLARDCGCVPVIDEKAQRILGLITDRDIAIRAVAAGKDPSRTTVAETMSHPPVVIQDESTLEACLKLMEENQVRRAPVVDHNGRLIGIVAQADIARLAPGEKVAALVTEVSKGPGFGHLL
jgi:CBS domain-containing protein